MDLNGHESISCHMRADRFVLGVRWIADERVGGSTMMADLNVKIQVAYQMLEVRHYDHISSLLRSKLYPAFYL